LRHRLLDDVGLLPVLGREHGRLGRRSLRRQRRLHLGPTDVVQPVTRPARRSATNAPATGSSPTTWWRPCGYPAAPPRTGPPTTASGSVCSTACNATAPARCGSIRDAAIVRRNPAGNSARAWVLRKTIDDRDFRDRVVR